jgi:hypothetical protein
MRLVRLAALVSVALVLPILGCGRKAHSKAEQAARDSALASPTPDFTPIAALRTPAGWLLLKTEQPAATPTPTPPPASSPKS